MSDREQQFREMEKKLRERTMTVTRPDWGDMRPSFGRSELTAQTVAESVRDIERSVDRRHEARAHDLISRLEYMAQFCAEPEDIMASSVEAMDALCEVRDTDTRRALAHSVQRYMAMAVRATSEQPVLKSREQIEKTLTQHGATAFGFYMDERVAFVAFKMKAHSVRFRVPLPSRDAKEFVFGGRGGTTRLSEEDRFTRWERACRGVWRSFSEALKGKLEIVNSGVSTFEAEFVAHIVTADDRTVYEHLKDQLNELASNGKAPTLPRGSL